MSRIAYLEDDADVHSIVEEYLGFKIDRYSNSVDMIANFSRYDVILTDFIIGEMINGGDVARKIRNLGFNGFIILLTGFMPDDPKIDSYADSFDYLIYKPLSHIDMDILKMLGQAYGSIL